MIVGMGLTLANRVRVLLNGEEQVGVKWARDGAADEGRVVLLSDEPPGYEIKHGLVRFDIPQNRMETIARMGEVIPICPLCDSPTLVTALKNIWFCIGCQMGFGSRSGPMPLVTARSMHVFPNRDEDRLDDEEAEEVVG